MGVMEERAREEDRRSMRVLRRGAMMVGDVWRGSC